MAYKPVLNDVLEARIITFDPTPPTQVGINVTHWLVTAVTTGGADVDEIAVSLDGVAAALYKTLLPSSVNYRGFMVQKLWPLPRSRAGTSVVNAGAGTQAAAQVPTQVAGLIKLFTDNSGRAFRGRIYLPFLPISGITAGGNAAAGYIAALTAFGFAFFSQDVIVGFGGTTTIVPVIWHNKAFGTPPGGAKTTTRIVSSTGSPLLATVRRRGNYGRVNPSSPI